MIAKRQTGRKQFQALDSGGGHGGRWRQAVEIMGVGFRRRTLRQAIQCGHLRLRTPPITGRRREIFNCQKTRLRRSRASEWLSAGFDSVRNREGIMQHLARTFQHNPAVDFEAQFPLLFTQVV